MNIDAYLHRIGLSQRPPPTLEGLRAVHRAHLLTVPYENLDVQLGRPVTVAVRAAYAKIVEGRRGGWCYEMNGLLGWALEELGFNVRRATGAVMREANGDSSNGNHLVLSVELPEGRYLADVGFGDGPLDPIRLIPGEFDSHGFVFRLSQVDDTWWRLHNHPGGGAPSFDFAMEPADESLFAERCHFLQTAEQSVFVQNVVCQRYTASGLTILRGRVLLKISGGQISKTEIGSDDQFVSVLENNFDLNIPEAASLWPKILARHEALFGGPVRNS